MQVTSTFEVNASNHQRLKSMQVTSTLEHERLKSMQVTSTLEGNASNINIRSQCK